MCTQSAGQVLDSEKPKPKHMEVAALTFSPCSLETCLLSFASHLFPRIIFSTSGEACWDKHRAETWAWLLQIHIVRQVRHPLSTQHRDASPENLPQISRHPQPITCTMAVLGSIAVAGNCHIRCPQKHRGYIPHNRSPSAKAFQKLLLTSIPLIFQVPRSVPLKKCNAPEAALITFRERNNTFKSVTSKERNYLFNIPHPVPNIFKRLFIGDVIH